MLFQLGNKIFNGLYAPNSWSESGNEANLAEYDLINVKPRLQKTGDTLAEVTLSFKLRVEFCNIEQEINDLEQWKSDGEILPLLMGNGNYKGDYLIRNVDKNILYTFPDGTYIDVDITVNLIEHVTDDAEAQQEATDRRNALAVGDKDQVVRRPVQPPTPQSSAFDDLLEAQNRAWETANVTQQAMQSAQPDTYIDKIKSSVVRAQKAMDNARSKIQDLQSTINNATGIVSSINQAKDRLTDIGNLMQAPLSLTNLGFAVGDLQISLNGISTSSIAFSQDKILRKI